MNNQNRIRTDVATGADGGSGLESAVGFAGKGQNFSGTLISQTNTCDPNNDLKVLDNSEVLLRTEAMIGLDLDFLQKDSEVNVLRSIHYGLLKRVTTTEK